MKRIALVITRFIPGGASEVVKQIIAGLHSSFRFILITGAEDFSAKELEEVSGYCEFFPVPDMVRKIDPLKDFKAYKELYRIFKKIKPDIVHTHTSKAGVIGRFAAKRAGTPFIIHSPHGCIYLPDSHISGLPEFSAGLKILQYAEKMAGANTQALTVLSRSEKEINVRLGLFPPEKIKIIPNGIDCRKFQDKSSFDYSDMLFSPEYLENKIVISAVGRLSSEKGQYILLEAVEMVLAKHSAKDLCVLLIGDGPDRKKLEEYADKISDSFNVEIAFPGYTKKVKEYLSLTDIFVMPSFYEGFGLALVEAMAAGLPVIASSSGGVPEIIDDGINGLLFPPGNAVALSEKLETLIENGNLKKTIAENAVRRAEMFDIKKMIEMYRKLYSAEAG
jgi:glycosyltransferase involved in cell wall biosynthesis